MLEWEIDVGAGILTSFLTESPDKSRHVQSPIIQYFLTNYSIMHRPVSHIGPGVAPNPLRYTYFDIR